MSREVSSSCECTMYDCESCGESFVSDYDPNIICPACSSDEVSEDGPFYDCDCYERGKEYAEEAWADWKDLNPSSTEWYVISGKDMGWMNRSGSRIIDNYDELFDVIQVDGDWTQYWPDNASSNSELVVTLSHHDSPTGETYTVRPATIEEVIVGIMESPDHENTWIGDIEAFLDEHFDPDGIDETRFRELAEAAYFDADDYLGS